MFAPRFLAVLVIGMGAVFAVPSIQAAQLAQGGQQTPKAPPPVPQAVIDSIAQAGCDPAKIEAAVKQAVSANKALAAEIAAIAVGQCPNDAAGIAAAAAEADPTEVAAIMVAVIGALPPNQQQNDAPGIMVALENAVPGSGDQITAAITALAFNPNDPGTNDRSNEGAPLVAQQTDVPSSPTGLTVTPR